MIIIVDGPDGAGKTTLCEKLLKAFPGSRIQHFGAPETPEQANNYYEVYARAITAAHSDEVVIFDRSWFSDMVYGPVMRNKLEMTAVHADMLSAMVVAHGGGMVVYCTAPDKVLWSRCKKRGETYIKDYQTLQRISDAYERTMKDKVAYLPVIRYDTSR